MRAKDLRLKSYKWRKDQLTVEMAIGMPEQAWKLKSPLRQGERARLELRWRRFPLTRELLLIAKDGTAFSLVAEVRTPWQELVLGDRLLISEHDDVNIMSAHITDDANPALPMACKIEVPPVDQDLWAEANR